MIISLILIGLFQSLLFVRSHEADISVVKRLTQSCNNLIEMGVRRFLILRQQRKTPSKQVLRPTRDKT